MYTVMVRHQSIHISARGPLHPYIYSLGQMALGRRGGRTAYPAVGRSGLLDQERDKEHIRVFSVFVYSIHYTKVLTYHSVEIVNT